MKNIMWVCLLLFACSPKKTQDLENVPASKDTVENSLDTNHIVYSDTTNNVKSSLDTNRYISFNQNIMDYYDILHQDTLPYIRIKEKTKNYKKRINDTISVDIWETELVDEDCEVKFVNISHTYLPFIYEEENDYFVLLGKKYVYTEIFKLFSKNEPFNYNFPIDFIGAYKFTIGNKKYMAWFFNLVHNATVADYVVMLYDITVKNSPKLIICEGQTSITAKCFGDFNKDGQLDYAKSHNEYGMNEYLICYTLENERFTKTDFYLTLTGGPLEAKIDLQKSHWFFDIAENKRRKPRKP